MMKARETELMGWVSLGSGRKDEEVVIGKECAPLRKNEARGIGWKER
jgi:hypothetical protein